LTSGGENIRFVKLRKDAPLTRFYSGCCHTPLGFTLDASPWYPCYGIYNETMSDYVTFLGPTTERLNVSSCKNRDLLPAKKKGEKWSEGLSVSFVMFLLRRVMFGVLFDRGTPDDFLALPQSMEPLILDQS